jgi:hypothetical protein
MAGPEGFGRGGPRGRGPVDEEVVERLRERGFGRGGRGRGGPRFRDADIPSADGAQAWFEGRLPEAWFTGSPEISVDRDEILVVGTIESPDKGSDAEAGRLSRFREETREQRMAIADEAEARYGRKVAWGAVAGETRQLFSTLSVPVMTRLRQPERQVLDTLVEAGVARSRSDALAWCVSLVAEHSDAWLAELREALTAVQRVREQGPGATAPESE